MQLREVTLAMTIALSCLSGAAQAGMLDPAIGPVEVGPVSVELNDNAIDACWTNLREVREYAEEKLRIEGYRLSDDSKAMVNFTLTIDVTGFRAKAAPVCVGSIIVIVSKAVVHEDLFGLHVINFENVVTTSSLNGNLNEGVIEIVQRTIDGM